MVMLLCFRVDVDPSSGLLTYQTPPTHPTGPRAPCRQDQGERGHLIYFYNTVYVKQMKDFALRYTSSSLTIAGVRGHFHILPNGVSSRHTQYIGNTLPVVSDMSKLWYNIIGIYRLIEVREVLVQMQCIVPRPSAIITVQQRF